jgi:F0F1-type ATP synthase assembly protein I
MELIQDIGILVSGGVVGVVIGWYFDAPASIQKVIDKVKALIN